MKKIEDFKKFKTLSKKEMTNINGGFSTRDITMFINNLRYVNADLKKLADELVNFLPASTF